MAKPTALPIDHLVINVHRNLPAAKGLFERLGFTLTPMGRHTMGSINHLLVFGDDYIEVIGLPADGAVGRSELLDGPIGMDGLVFKTDDADKTHARLAAAREPLLPVQSFSRPVELDGRVDWQDTILGDAPDGADDAGGGVLTPDAITGFDLAPYVVAPGERAFGLLGEWNVGYAGGGAQYHALYLFAVEDGVVTQILATPMSFSKMLAGDWHKDGTRDHDLSEGANVLVVTTHMTDGHFDLLQKTRGGGASRVFRWSAAAKRYEPDGR